MGANESGDHRAAIDLAQRAGELFDKLDDTVGRCAALTLAGNAHKALSNLPAAKAAYRVCLERARAAGFMRGVTVSLNNLGTLAHNEAEYGLARDYYRQSLEVKYEVGDERGIAVTLMNLGAIANDLGEYEVARTELARARELTEEPYSVAFGLVLLAEAQCGLGDYDAAYASATEGLRISREVQHDPTIALALTRLGDIAAATGDRRRADALYREALAHSGAVPEVARTLERLAGVQADVAPEEAAELLTRAEQMRRTHGTPVPPVDRAGIARTRETLASR